MAGRQSDNRRPEKRVVKTLGQARRGGVRVANVGGKGLEAAEEDVEPYSEAADDDDEVADVVCHDRQHQEVGDGQVEGVKPRQNHPPQTLPVPQPACMHAS